MEEYVKAAAYLAAALTIAIGTLMPAFSQGLIGSRACENMGKYPESIGKIQTMAFLAMAMVETLALFALLTAIMIIFSVR
jgi:F-type H+-transporting ATPase subunit c